jgi:magnesium transporter
MVDVNKVKDFLEQDKINRIKPIIKQNEDDDLVRIIDQLDNKNKIKFYLLIPTRRASNVLLDVSTHSRKIILKGLKNKYVVSIIEKSESDDSADILGEISEHNARKIIQELPEEKKEAIVPLIKYEEDTAGGLMKSELLSIKGSLKVKEAINILKKDDLADVNYIYVVDSEDKLKGVVTLNDLITATSDKKISSIMNKDIVTLNPNLDKEDVAEIFRQEDIMALPVVDDKGKLLGRVTVDDVLDVLQEEATEDLYKLAGVNPDEHIFDPLFSSIKKRLPWLMINLVTAFIAAFTVSLFKDTLQTVIILAAFMPMIAGIGGNSGTQTLTLIVRGLALNQLTPGSYKKIVFKEIFVGVLNGIILGTIVGTIASIWQQNIMLGVVILLAMTISTTLAGFIATSVPLIFKSMKIDPAIASSVFITASIDIIGFFSFLGIATLLLGSLV